mgnify:CR=1 FL=1
MEGYRKGGKVFKVLALALALLIFAPSAWAGTLTISRTDLWGNTYVSFGSFTFSSSYGSAGESANPGLRVIEKVVVDQVVSGYVIAYDYTNKKLRAYRSGAVTVAGTISAPTFTGGAASLTATASAPAFTGGAASLTATSTAPTITAGTGTPTDALGVDTGAIVKTSGATGITGVQAPTITVGAYTPAGTVAAPTITPGAYTPAGTVSAPTLTGTTVAAGPLVEVTAGANLSAITVQVISSAQ